MVQTSTQSFLDSIVLPEGLDQSNNDLKVGMRMFGLFHLLALKGRDFGIAPLFETKIKQGGMERYNYINFICPSETITTWFDKLDLDAPFKIWVNSLSTMLVKDQEVLLEWLQYSHPGKAGCGGARDYKACITAQNHEREIFKATSPPNCVPQEGSVVRGFMIRNDLSVTSLHPAIQSKITYVKEQL